MSLKAYTRFTGGSNHLINKLSYIHVGPHSFLRANIMSVTTKVYPAKITIDKLGCFQAMPYCQQQPLQSEVCKLNVHFILICELHFYVNHYAYNNNVHVR